MRKRRPNVWFGCSLAAHYFNLKYCPEYSETCVRKPSLTLVADVERWLSYKGTCHVILLAKLHDMYRYKKDAFRINHYLKSVSKVALLHRFHCTRKQLTLSTLDTKKSVDDILKYFS